MEYIKLIFELINPDASQEDEINSDVFDLVDKYVEEHFHEDFCELLITSVEPQTDLRKVARTLDILVWSTPDNGKKLDNLTSNWLSSKNGNKIRAILYRKDWLPNSNWNELSKHLVQLDSTLEPLVQYYTNEVEYWNRTGLRNINLLEEAIKAGNKHYHP